MLIVDTKTAFYPAFHLGNQPCSVECTLCIVEANGRKYFKTPFAFVDSHGDDLTRAVMPGGGYYATKELCDQYLEQEYPWAERAEPIMEALHSSRYYHGDLVGTGRVADQCGVTTDEIFKLARGHKSVGLKAVKAALKAIRGDA